jgi:hypothetical protein
VLCGVGSLIFASSAHHGEELVEILVAITAGGTTAGMA